MVDVAPEVPGSPAGGPALAGDGVAVGLADEDGDGVLLGFGDGVLLGFGEGLGDGPVAVAVGDGLGDGVVLGAVDDGLGEGVVLSAVDGEGDGLPVVGAPVVGAPWSERPWSERPWSERPWSERPWSERLWLRPQWSATRLLPPRRRTAGPPRTRPLSRRRRQELAGQGLPTSVLHASTTQTHDASST